MANAATSGTVNLSTNDGLAVVKNGSYAWDTNGITYRGPLKNLGTDSHVAYFYAQISGYGYATLATATSGHTANFAARVYDPDVTRAYTSKAQVCRDRSFPLPQNCVSGSYNR